jgi:hypothetical protein
MILCRAAADHPPVIPPGEAHLRAYLRVRGKLSKAIPTKSVRQAQNVLAAARAFANVRWAGKTGA